MTICEKALSCGFADAVLFDAALVTPQERIRTLCSPKSCQSYGRCWLCPPCCKTLDEMDAALSTYKNAMLLTSRFLPCRPDDMEEAARLAKQHSARMLRLAAEQPGCLILTVGGCRLCESCTCPQEPCRRSDLHLGAVSAYGIDVSEICQKLGVPFAFERGKLCFVGFLFW